ncbi:MAG: hypothetical protein HQK49_04030 [Oligoflexia bacterium]|nr:hypothetical protein [Oligoflexia bacterium]
MLLEELSNTIFKYFLSKYDRNDHITYSRACTIVTCYVCVTFFTIPAFIYFLFFNDYLPNAKGVLAVVSFLPIISFINLMFVKINKLNITIAFTFFLACILVVGGLVTKNTHETAPLFVINIFYALVALNIFSILGTKKQLVTFSIIFALSIALYYFYVKDIFPTNLNRLLVVGCIIGISSLVVNSTISYSHINISEHLLKKILNETDHSSNLNFRLNNMYKKRESELKIVNEKFSKVNHEIVIADHSISQTLRKNNEYGEKSNQLVQSMLIKTETNKEVLDEMSKSFKAIKDANSQLNNIINLFSSIFSRIGIINDLAFETKILSFNASIEAARAGGVEGQGFSVVALEVGNLAKKSSDAANDIAEMLEKSKIQVMEIVENINNQTNAASVVNVNTKEKYLQLAAEMEQLAQQMDLLKKNNFDQEKIIKNHFAAMKI